MPSESELVAKARRAALAFGMSPADADASVRQVAAVAGRMSRSAGTQRDQVLIAENERQREFKRLDALIEEARNSNEWKVKKTFPMRVNNMTMMQTSYYLPDIVITTLRGEATTRIEIAYQARVRVARLIAQQ